MASASGRAAECPAGKHRDPGIRGGRGQGRVQKDSGHHPGRDQPQQSQGIPQEAQAQQIVSELPAPLVPPTPLNAVVPATQLRAHERDMQHPQRRARAQAARGAGGKAQGHVRGDPGTLPAQLPAATQELSVLRVRSGARGRVRSGARGRVRFAARLTIWAARAGTRSTSFASCWARTSICRRVAAGVGGAWPRHVLTGPPPGAVLPAAQEHREALRPGPDLEEDLQGPAVGVHPLGLTMKWTRPWPWRGARR